MLSEKKPLDGYRIFDFTAAKSGPYCTMLLCNFGAEVIHIENPDREDPVRKMKPSFLNTSTEYFSLNMGKKNVQLNTKMPEGKDLAYKLITKCDIFVENGKPGSAAKMGLGYEDIKKIKPDIIYASISGFGQDGPYRDRVAFDTVIQAMSGFMSITGPEGGEPTKAGPSLSDIIAGLTCALGIVAAVVRREKTGEGTYLDLAMLDSYISMLDVAVDAYLNGGEIRHPMGNRHPANAIAEPVKCKDGSFILQMFGEEQHKRFCEAFHMKDFTEDPRFCSGPQRVKNRDVLVHDIVEPVLAEYTLEEVSKILLKYKIPFGEISTIDQVMENPQVRFRDCFVNVTDSRNGIHKIYGSPFKFSNFSMPKETFCDQPGEHNRSVLHEVLNMDDASITDILTKMGANIN